MKTLWEILVPTVRNDGQAIHTRFHRVWDAKIRALTDGLTIFAPAKGQWVHPEGGALFAERMIPVRIYCTREQIDQIVDITMNYYDQHAVMAYQIAEHVILRERS